MRQRSGMMNSANNISAEVVRRAVKEILTRVLCIDDVSEVLQLDRTNPNWDSLKQLQIGLELEDFFRIELSDEEAIDFFDIDSITKLIERIQKNEN